jgi:lysozyme
MKREQLILLGITGLIIILAFTKKGQEIVSETVKTITNLGVNLVRRLEGFSDTVYKDVAGFWTIGYGHKIIPGESFFPYGSNRNISETDAVNLLAQDMETAANTVQNSVTVPLNEQQFNSLVSFVFNVGVNAFNNSTLLKKLNSGDYENAASELDRWVYVTQDGQKVVSDGLVARREQEKNLFLS